MRFKKLSGWILMVVLLTAALVLAGGGAALANKHYVDDINDLHCDGDDNCEVPLSESKVAGGELKSGDTIVLNFSESNLQTQSVIVDLENVTIRGAHGPDGTTVYAGEEFVGSDGGNSTMFQIRRGGVALKDFKLTSDDEDSELSSAVLVTGAEGKCPQNSGKNLLFENLKVAESNDYGGSDLINRAFHFVACCNDYDNTTFQNVTIGELGTDDDNTVAGIHFDEEVDDPDLSPDDTSYNVKNLTVENSSIGETTGVAGPGMLFENKGDLENIVVDDTLIGDDNSGHGIEVVGGNHVEDIDGFQVVDSAIDSNGKSGIWIGGEWDTTDELLGEEEDPVGEVAGLLIDDSSLSKHPGFGLY
ncbi:MAG: hypothetical protein ACLFN4_04635, partial [Candidatus Acetothermia bacterium]